VSANQQPFPHPGNAERVRQGEALQQREQELGRFASNKNKEEFFREVVPLIAPLKTYIKRQLRFAYGTQEIRTPVSSSGDIVDQVILRAYEGFDKKPKELTLEQWLYQLARETLDKYIQKRRASDARRQSFEDLRAKDLRDLDEIPFTTDAEGEIYETEDLDDSEYHLGDFIPKPDPPSEPADPAEELDKAERVVRIVQALSHVPEQERRIFELFAIEGFSQQEVARIYNLSPAEVARIIEKVRGQVLQEISADRGSAEDIGTRQKAS